ncbi:condensation domain-containing protein [Rheinheimera baltica]|uniref:Condensation domain-containing protein n=1 Tax=Rheinheimera baltica TaxID=67576 RepID=A0ABT9HVP5_9GAMM|nr:condensation domain-containing protein [Rheinheimera baltica]MDP5134761.1 condensation domain-containing protein [Rheinheimera baltica]
MTPNSFIKELLQRGLRLSCENGKLLLHGDKGQMDECLLQQIKTYKLALMELLQVSSIHADKAADSFPLSYAQQEILPIALSDPQGSQFNLCSAVILKGELDLAAAELAALNLLQCHPSLRTKFTYDASSGESSQTVFKTSNSPLHWESWPYLQSEEDANPTVVKEFCYKLACKPFDLGGGLLLRIHLCNLHDNNWLLVMVRHHICSDGWSFAILVKDYCHAYELAKSDPAATLPETKLSYQQFVLDEQRFLQSDRARAVETYWQQQTSIRQTTLVPFDIETNAPYGLAGVNHFTLTEKLHEKVSALAIQQSMSLYCVLFTMFNTLITFYRQFQCLENDSICVGTDVTMRDSVGLEQVVGLFVNRLPLSFSYNLQMSFNQALSVTRNVINNGMQNKALPQSVMVASLRDNGAADVSLYSALFGFHNNPHSRFSMEKLVVTDAFFFPPLSTNVPLTLYFTNQNNGLIAELIYRKDLYFERTIQEIIYLFARLLEIFVCAPDTSLETGYAIFCTALDEVRREQRQRFQRKSSRVKRDMDKQYYG